MFKVSLIRCEIIEYPAASMRGKTQVYTGNNGRKGAKEWESAVNWYKTYDDAKQALCDYYYNNAEIYKKRYEQMTILLEKAKNL